MQKKKGKIKRTLIVTTALILVMSGLASALACTSVYFGKDTTENGSYFWGRSEDISASFGKLFNVQEAEEHEAGEYYVSGAWNSAYTTFTPYFKWPYPKKTLRYTYCSDTLYNERFAPQSYAEVGTNEKGVSMSATVTLSGTKSQITSADPSVSRANGGLSEVDVTTAVLMQAETARGACELIAEIIDTVGASGREGVMISDPNEVWFFQWLSGHQYVAVKCPDDSIGLSPNITGNVGDKDGYVDITDTENVIVSPNFVSIPKAAGVLVAKDNDTKVKVADTYSSAAVGGTPGSDNWSGRLQSGYGYLYGLTTNAELRAFIPTQVQYLDYFKAPRQNGKYSLYEAMRILGHRGEGTEWEAASSIGNGSTVEAHIFENRPNMPAELATIEWICLAPAEFGVYLPYFGNLTTEVFEKNYAPDAGRHAPSPLKTGYDNDDPDNNSVYWVFRELYAQCAATNLAERRRLGDGVKAFWERYQKSLIAQQADVDAALQGINTFDSDLAAKTATEVSKAVSAQTYEYAKTILAELKAFKAAGTAGDFIPSVNLDAAALPNYAPLAQSFGALSAAMEAYQNGDKPAGWSHNAYTNALVFDDAVVSQADVDAKAAALDSIVGLLPQIASIDETLAFYADCTANDYTPETFVPFKIASLHAADVYADADATPEAIMGAWNGLYNGREALDTPRFALSAGQPKTVSLKVGQTYQLQIDANTALIYVSSSPCVSTTQKGVLTGVKAGVAVVTVRLLWNPAQVLNIVVSCTK